jgi:hypothetical protein
MMNLNEFSIQSKYDLLTFDFVDHHIKNIQKPQKSGDTYKIRKFSEKSERSGNPGSH